MAEAGSRRGGAAAGPALPKPHLLSYISTVSTPTKVRRVACVGMRVVAGIELLVALMLILYMGSVVRDVLIDRHAGGGWIGPGGAMAPLPAPITFREVFETTRGVTGRLPLFPLLAFLLCIVAVFQLTMAGGVKRGHRLASVCEFFALGPLALIVALFVAHLSGLAGVNFLEYPNDIPLGLRELLAVPAGALGLGLLSDLGGFLMWIARNPLTEKAPVPFLPRR